MFKEPLTYFKGAVSGKAFFMQRPSLGETRRVERSQLKGLRRVFCLSLNRSQLFGKPSVLGLGWGSGLGLGLGSGFGFWLRLRFRLVFRICWLGIGCWLWTRTGFRRPVDRADYMVVFWVWLGVSSFGAGLFFFIVASSKDKKLKLLLKLKRQRRLWFFLEELLFSSVMLAY